MLAPGRSEAQDTPMAFISATESNDLPEGAVRTLTLGLRNVSKTTPRTTFMLTLSGDAVRGSDYTLSCNTAAGVTCSLSGDSPSITVTPSQLDNVRGVSNLLKVTAIADDTKEDPETVGFSLGSNTSSFGIVDAPNKTTVRFNTAMAIGTEGGSSGDYPNVPMTVDPPFGSDIDINFMVSGTATSGADYTTIPMPLTIPAGTDVFRSFIITLIDDALVEGDETIILTMSDLPDSVSAGDPSTVTIFITDDEDPSGISITSDATASVAENTTQVLDVTAANTAGTVTTYSTGGGADRNLFNLNRTSGALTFKTAPNFEMPTDQGGDNVYEVFVVARDGVGRADFQTITVTVTDVNEPPMLAPTATKSIAENVVDVLTVIATDPDTGTTLTYSITGGADSTRFSIDQSTGDLTFKTAPDFEAGSADGDDDYEVEVTVSDGTNSAMQTITVTVTDENDNPPMITSPATASVAENTIDVVTVTATDEDTGTTLTYSITGGADSARFSIDQSTGDLTFKTAPDFEAGSADGDDDYEVEVTVSDGTNSAMQTITVTVTDVNDNDPVITSLTTASVVEGTTTVLTVTATDADAGTILTYSVSGGADRALFRINQTSGALTFATAPDFEALGSADNSNVYEVEVMVSDGTNSTMQTITVTVTNDPSDDILGFSEAEEVRLYPNPASDYFKLIGAPTGLKRVSLFNTSGKVVRTYPTSQDGVYNVSALGQGIFFVFTEGDEGQKYAGRIVIRRGKI